MVLGSLNLYLFVYGDKYESEVVGYRVVDMVGKPAYHVPVFSANVEGVEKKLGSGLRSITRPFLEGEKVTIHIRNGKALIRGFRHMAVGPIIALFGGIGAIVVGWLGGSCWVASGANYGKPSRSKIAKQGK